MSFVTDEVNKMKLLRWLMKQIKELSEIAEEFGHHFEKLVLHVLMLSFFGYHIAEILLILVVQAGDMSNKLSRT